MHLAPSLLILFCAAALFEPLNATQAADWSAAKVSLPESMQVQADEVRSAGYEFDKDLITKWRESLDPQAVSTAPLASLADAGFANEAFHLWALQKLSHLRETDFGRFGWHDYHQHPARGGIADLLAGKITPEDYYSAPADKVHFLDIFEMRNALLDPASGSILWLRDRRDPHVWSQWANLPENDRMNKSDYRNFEIFTSLAGRYWKTGDPVYRRTLLRLQADFHRHHYEDFWALYRGREIDDKDVQAICQADWRSNTNALMEGWRLQNSLRQLAALAKSAAPDKAVSWDDVLAPASAPLPANAFDVEELSNVGWTLLGAAQQYPEKLVWFIRSGAVPNQKMEALAALSRLEAMLPENRFVNTFREFVARETSRFVTENFLPDGGMLEQSLNYNYNTRENLERLVDAQNPASSLIQRENARFDGMLNSIRGPLGTLPQIGNNKLGDRGPGSPVTDLPPSSVAHPYSGYYALRSGGSPDDAWLFFKNSRLQRGHLTRDNNGIQFTAFGRPLLVCGGPPDYELNSDPTVHAAREYFSEDSSLKANTVLVDGHSLAAWGNPLQAAPLSPMPSVWLDTAQVAVVDGLYADGYGGISLTNASASSPDVKHLRTVYLFKQPRAALVVDRMIPADNTTHHYTQIWKFPPVLDSSKEPLDGFHEDEVMHDKEAGIIQTKDPDGANVALLHEGVIRPAYAKYHGNSEPVLGWYAPGLSTAVPAVDYHASWKASGESVLLTWIVPSAPGAGTEIERVDRKIEGGILRSTIRLPDGTKLSYAAAEGATDLFGTGIACVEAVKFSASDEPDWVVASSGWSEGEPGVLRFLLKDDPSWEVEKEAFPLIGPNLETRRVGSDIEVRIDSKAAGASRFEVLGGRKLDSPATGEPILLRPGEGLSAWLDGREAHASFVLNMPGADPIPEPVSTPPNGVEPGWLRHERLFPRPARLYDATLRTLFDSSSTVRVGNLETPKTKGTVAVFEGWIKIPESGDYIISLSAQRQGALNFRAANGQLLPPLLLADNHTPGKTTVHLEAGFYEAVVTVGGFYDAIPEVFLQISPYDSPEDPLEIQVFAPAEK